jgi:hypothetical protein
MILAIHQPEFLCWPGFFDKMYRSDIFVILDTVQFRKNYYQNRNKIKTKIGWSWLTVPLKRPVFGKKICDVEIAGDQWKIKHLIILQKNYRSSPFYNNYINGLSIIYEKNWEKLSSLNVELIKLLMGYLGFHRKIILASELNLEEKKGTDLLIDICKKFNADTYLSGEGGYNYLNLERFREEKIEILFRHYNYPKYSQQFEKEADFIPNLSTIDLLFNCGEDSLNILLKQDNLRQIS